jgi:hypothetical protein
MISSPSSALLIQWMMMTGITECETVVSSFQERHESYTRRKKIIHKKHNLIIFLTKKKICEGQNTYNCYGDAHLEDRSIGLVSHAFTECDAIEETRK